MVNITINGKSIQASQQETILQAAARNGIRIPTLCYFEQLNTPGACRVCVVEIKGQQHLFAACNTLVAEGMEILTESKRVRLARKVNVQLLLSRHNCACLSCPRSGNCALQSLAEELHIIQKPYPEKIKSEQWDGRFPLLRDESKCIKCWRCVQVCDRIQDLRVWQITGTGARTRVSIRDNLSMTDAGCTLCGQCITHCPVGALNARDDTEKVFDALEDPEKIVVMQIAPAVRSAWGDMLGLPEKDATVGRMAAAARALGAKYVLDTNFAADLTIMEEAEELIERLKNGQNLPLFTSCCPGWVRYAKLHYPALLPHLSTAKSPQQMFGAVIKSYFARKYGIEPEKILTVSVMPCTAKKYECDVPQVNASAKDVDIVLTTREFGHMLKAAHVNPYLLQDEPFDTPFGQGAGVIFGASGGVMEQALRSACFMLTGENPDAQAFYGIRQVSPEGVLRADYTVSGITLHTAVASGLKNARALCEEVLSGNTNLDFIEIMACPGGCVGGGGQPIADGIEQSETRRDTLYAIEGKNPYLYAHQNPAIHTFYADLNEQKDGSEEIHRLLHTNQSSWDI